MKKLIALTLALIMVFSMAAVVFADGEKGSITINGVSENVTYEVYRMLDLESYDVSAGAYSYKVNSAWSGFFATAEAKKYVAIAADGYVTWIAAEDDDTKATFAKLALAYAKDEEHPIAPVKSSKNEGDFVITDNTGKFADLDLGYYLVDSSVGALCGLTTTNPNASINAKNGIPTVDKQVLEDGTNQWTDTNTADIGQIIEFRTTINVHAGAENYILHDSMSAGLTFKQDSSDKPFASDPAKQDVFRGVWKVEHVVPGTGTTVLSADKYTVKTTGMDHEEGVNCTFEVIFDEDFCATLEHNDKLIVYYTAMLNRDAIIAGEGNSNEAWLEFGEGNDSGHDTTTTKTFGFDIVKTDSQNALIDGAKFKIYDKETEGNEVPVVILDAVITDDASQALTDSAGNKMMFDHDNDPETDAKMVSKINTYRRARADETGVEIIVNDGQVRVAGFDNGTYYLEEIDAPDGFNKLTGRQKFIIGDANLDAVYNTDEHGNKVFSSGSGVHVVNKTGSMLPETGAMGTLLFISFGMFVALGTGVLLVTKKRMSLIED